MMLDIVYEQNKICGELILVITDHCGDTWLISVSMLSQTFSDNKWERLRCTQGVLTLSSFNVFFSKQG